MANSNKPIVDVKHVFAELHYSPDEELYPHFHIELPPFGKVNVLIQREFPAAYVCEDGDMNEYHRHYGQVKYRLVYDGQENGAKLTKLLVNLCSEAGAMIGMDGWLRVTGDGDHLRDCISRERECPVIWYIKPQELFIFPKKPMS